MPRIPDDPDALMPHPRLREVLRRLADREEPTDPLDVLADVRALHDLLAPFQDAAIREALALAYTWDEVAEVTGLSRATLNRKVRPKSAQGPGWTRKGRTA